MAKKNFRSILSGTLGFDPEKYLNKSLLFDLKQKVQEKCLMQWLKNYFLEHHDGTNAFCIRKDEKEVEKDKIINLMEVIDSKINKSTNKSWISQLKRMRKELLNNCSSLRETFGNIDDEKTETLDKLLDIDRKLATGEI